MPIAQPTARRAKRDHRIKARNLADRVDYEREQKPDPRAYLDHED